MNVLKLTALACGAMLLAQCSSNKVAQEATGSAPQKGATAKISPEVIDSLTGDWAVVEAAGELVNLDQLPTVNLSANDSDLIAGGADNVVLVFAFSGCNTINGALEVQQGRKMQPKGEFLSTMMLCPGVNYDSQVSQAVQGVSSYDLAVNDGESTLSLYDKGGKRLMRLRKHNLEFLNGAWKVTKLGDTAVPASSSMGLVIDLPEGKVHADGGCNTINGTVAQVLDTDAGIRFTDLSSTRMTCPDIEREMQFVEALGKVAKAVKGGKMKTAILEDASGKALITLRRVDMQELRLLNE